MSLIENIRIDDNVYHVLLGLLKKKTGLNFQYYRRAHIEKRIMARMIRVKCKTLESYYEYLFSNQDEIRKFLDSFNINFTFFFRDWEVYETFQNIFLKGLKCEKGAVLSIIKPRPSQLAKAKGDYLKRLAKTEKFIDSLRNFLKNITQFSFYQNLKSPKTTASPIRIWSCPCASGEEPYTIAMILDNLRDQIQNFPKYEIVSSDIDNDAIFHAITGIYSEDSMREITDFYKNKYFKKIKSRLGYEYLLSEEVKNHVEFINEDVTKGHKKSNKYDIIFCRYLLIYFNQLNRRMFINTILNRLKSGGLLILGRTETLLESFNLKLIDSKNRIYLKY